MHGEEEVYTQRCISGKSATDGNGDGNREQSSEVRKDTLVESNRSLTFLPHAVSTANKTLIRDGRIYRTTELRCPSFLSFSFSFSFYLLSSLLGSNSPRLTLVLSHQRATQSSL